MHGRGALLAFSQLSLTSQGVFANPSHFASQFRSLEAISQSKGDFAAKGKFRSSKVISQSKAIFAAKGQFRRPFRSPFRSSKVISQAISQLENGSVGLRNGTHVPKGRFTVVKIFARGEAWAAK